MIKVRKAADRGHFDHGWLNTYHTFSFADYWDEDFMGFRDLRVINEDRVQGGRGFGTHAHRDMEIISYVLSGELQHRDSLGNGSIIAPGNLQRMSAGTGVRHSEFNPSQENLLHFLQIWILPESPGITPGYEERKFEETERKGKLLLLASHDGRGGSATIHQDVDLHTAALDAGNDVTFEYRPNRYGWIQVTRGEVAVGETRLAAGDGAAISDEKSVTVRGVSDGSEILLFDLR